MAGATIPCELYYGKLAKSMGKRELVLIVVFVDVRRRRLPAHRAAAAPAGSQGVSFGGIVATSSGARSAARANRRTPTRTQTSAVDAAVSELRINVSRPNELTVTGEDRAATSRSSCTSRRRGFDEAEAQGRRRRQRSCTSNAPATRWSCASTSLHRALPRKARSDAADDPLKVPQRLRMRLEPHSAALDGQQPRPARDHGHRAARRSVTNIAGHVAVTHRRQVAIDGVGVAQAQRAQQRGSVNTLPARSRHPDAGRRAHARRTSPARSRSRRATPRSSSTTSRTAKRRSASTATAGSCGSRPPDRARIDGRNTEHRRRARRGRARSRSTAPARTSSSRRRPAATRSTPSRPKGASRSTTARSSRSGNDGEPRVAGPCAAADRRSRCARRAATSRVTQSLRGK